MAQYSPVYGVILSIEPFDTGSQTGCGSLSFRLMTQDMGPVQLIVTPDTYVEDQETLEPGDVITAFYDSTAPMPLIYPPRYTAVVIAEADEKTHASLDYFNEELVNTDGTLKLNPGSRDQTCIQLSNGQTFFGSLGNHCLLVLYSASTRSIPAITVPEKITVFCGNTSG